MTGESVADDAAPDGVKVLPPNSLVIATTPPRCWRCGSVAGGGEGEGEGVLTALVVVTGSSPNQVPSLTHPMRRI